MKVIAEFHLGPGYAIDDHTVIAEGAEIDWSGMSKSLRPGFTGAPIGEVLDIGQDGGNVVVKAEVESDKLHQIIDAGLTEFQPAFIVRKMRIEGDKRIIEAADLMGISIGFRYEPEAKSSYWKRFKAWLQTLIS